MLSKKSVNASVTVIATIEIDDKVSIRPMARLNELGEALLDFGEVGDFLAWLDQNQ